jgi:dolichyl-phosphate beta-glucosyltransferase
VNNIYLSVVVPCYNEKENLQRGALAGIRDYLEKQAYVWEVIIVNDESTDGSEMLIREFCQKNPGFKLVSIQHGGKAVAVYRGVEEARGELTLFTDMDQSTPISELDKLIPKIKEGSDIAIGSRGLERKNFTLFRKLASFVFRRIRLAILSSHIIDTQAGFKIFRSSVAKELFPLLSVIRKAGIAKGWKVSAFDVELLTIAEVRGYKVSEVPILWEDRDESTGKARSPNKFVRESLDMIREVLRVKYNKTMGHYKK